MIIQSPKFIEKPLVSVLIITYNQEQTIRQTIDSVLAQQCDFPYEKIIGEDYGIDGTRNICEEYQQKHSEKIKLLLFEKNGGVVLNWISCVKEAKGKFIGSCAGDDYWHNAEKLQLQVDFMESHTSCGVLHTDFDQLNVVSDKIVKSYYKTNKIEIPSGFLQKELFDGTLKMTAPTICFRKELFDKYIPMDDYISLKFPIEDWPTLVILSHYTEFYYLPVSTVTYRVGHESISNPKSYERINQRFKHEKQMYKYLCDMFPQSLSFDEKGYDLYVQCILLNLAYKKWDYQSAQKYSDALLKLGASNFKIKSARNPLFFILFCLFKKMKSVLS